MNDDNACSFYIVRYVGENENSIDWIPDTWLLMCLDEFPYFSKAFYYPASKDVIPLNKTLYDQMEGRFPSKKQPGMVYEVKVLEKFGMIIMEFLIFYSIVLYCHKLFVSSQTSFTILG